MHHGDVSPEIAAGLLALKKRIAAAKIPPSQLDQTINVAVWNIREFGKKRRVIGFDIRADRVADLVTAKMALIDRPRPRLIMVRATLERHVFAFVWLPRDQLSTDVRLQIQAMLLATPGAALLDWSLEVESSSLALLRFLIDVRACADLPDDAAIEAKLVDLLRGWNEAVESHLATGDEDGRAAALAARYLRALAGRTSAVGVKDVGLGHR